MQLVTLQEALCAQTSEMRDEGHDVRDHMDLYPDCDLVFGMGGPGPLLGPTVFDFRSPDVT